MKTVKSNNDDETKFKKNKKIKIPGAKSLAKIYEENPDKTAVEIAKLAKVDYAYAKKFIKSKDESKETFKELRTDKKAKKYVPCGHQSNFHWQADCMFLNDYTKQNKQHKGILTLLNTTTREANARAIKGTTAEEITKKMLEMIYQVGRMKVAILRTDGGSEFDNALFRSAMEEEGIEFEMAEAHTHSWLNRTNRFHRTLKGMIRDHFKLHGNLKWVDDLYFLIGMYNNSPNAAFEDFDEDITPHEMMDDDVKLKIIHQEEKNKANEVKDIDSGKLKVGDYVRLYFPKTKAQIELNGKFIKKSMAATWSDKVYKIIERTGPNFWRIELGVMPPNGVGAQEPQGEIEQWQTYYLKKSTEKAYNEQHEQVAINEVNDQAISSGRAAREEARNISVVEQRDNLKAVGQLRSKSAQMITRGSKMTTRSKKAKVDDEEPAYIHQKVLGKSLIDGLVHYKIRWKGLSAKHDSWEPFRELRAKVPDLIKVYNNKNKLN
jgi:hypothetical protein